MITEFTKVDKGPCCDIMLCTPQYLPIGFYIMGHNINQIYIITISLIRPAQRETNLSLKIIWVFGYSIQFDVTWLSYTSKYFCRIGLRVYNFLIWIEYEDYFVTLVRYMISSVILYHAMPWYTMLFHNLISSHLICLTIPSYLIVNVTTYRPSAAVFS